MTNDAKTIRILLKIEPEFEYEGQFDSQAEINAYKSGFFDCKERAVSIFKHTHQASESGNCGICGEDFRHAIHFRTTLNHLPLIDV